MAICSSVLANLLQCVVRPSQVKLPECDDDDDIKLVKMKLLLSRTSGLNCSTDRKQTNKNAAVNVTESSTTGLGVTTALF